MKFGQQFQRFIATVLVATIICSILSIAGCSVGQNNTITNNEVEKTDKYQPQNSTKAVAPIVKFDCQLTISEKTNNSKSTASQQEVDFSVKMPNGEIITDGMIFIERMAHNNFNSIELPVKVFKKSVNIKDSPKYLGRITFFASELQCTKNIHGQKVYKRNISVQEEILESGISNTKGNQIIFKASLLDALMTYSDPLIKYLLRSNLQGNSVSGSFPFKHGARDMNQFIDAICYKGLPSYVISLPLLLRIGLNPATARFLATLIAGLIMAMVLWEPGYVVDDPDPYHSPSPPSNNNPSPGSGSGGGQGGSTSPANHPPNKPTICQPLNGDFKKSGQITFEIIHNGDPENDPINYNHWIYKSNGDLVCNRGWINNRYLDWTLSGGDYCYIGEVGDGKCGTKSDPVHFSVNFPPNKPVVNQPGNNTIVRNGEITFECYEKGDPDDKPNSKRNYVYRIFDSSWNLIADSGWIDNRYYMRTLGPGVYIYQPEVGDGLQSTKADPSTFTVCYAAGDSIRFLQWPGTVGSPEMPEFNTKYMKRSEQFWLDIWVYNTGSTVLKTNEYYILYNQTLSGYPGHIYLERDVRPGEVYNKRLFFTAPSQQIDKILTFRFGKDSNQDFGPYQNWKMVITN